jgi:hypothetical protein
MLTFFLTSFHMNDGSVSLFSPPFYLPSVFLSSQQVKSFSIYSCGEAVFENAQWYELFCHSFAKMMSEMRETTKELSAASDTHGRVVVEKQVIRQKFNFDVMPFLCSKARGPKAKKEKGDKKQESNSSLMIGLPVTEDGDSTADSKLVEAYTAHTLPRHDRHRSTLQVLFLSLMRELVPLRYVTVESFLAQKAYSGFKDRTPDEVTRLHSYANWFDLVLLTVKPENNKSFLMTVVPRLVEGEAAKYITGSGESVQTSDRVLTYRTEGNCVQVKRAPRNRTTYSTTRPRKRPFEEAAKALQSISQCSYDEFDPDYPSADNSGLDIPYGGIIGMGIVGSVRNKSSVDCDISDITPPAPCTLDAAADDAVPSAHFKYFNGLTSSTRNSVVGGSHGKAMNCYEDSFLRVKPSGHGNTDGRITGFSSRGKVGSKYGGIFKKMVDRRTSPWTGRDTLLDQPPVDDLDCMNNDPLVVMATLAMRTPR